MATQLPFSAIKRSRIPSQCPKNQQIRHASLLKRPIRPYTFTQLITLSDGSTYTARTTSPAPVLRSTKDTRNHPLWQPSLLSLQNVEKDEAGRLRAFRERFGRGWDLEAAEEEGEAEKKDQAAEDDSLMDLISGSAKATEAPSPTITKGKNVGKGQSKGKQ